MEQFIKEIDLINSVMGLEYNFDLMELNILVNERITILMDKEVFYLSMELNIKVFLF